MEWNGKPYHSLDYELRQQFGQKIYKLSLDGGMTCPNRDGTLGTGGCIFCSEGGSGDFAAPRQTAVSRQIEQAMAQVKRKMPDGSQGSYIAYFQSYTNTYAPLPYLKQLFGEAVSHPAIAAGFTGTQAYVADAFGVELDARANVATERGAYRTSADQIFTAGDMHRGQSLVVWAIQEGREAAKAVDRDMMGYTNLA